MMALIPIQYRILGAIGLLLALVFAEQAYEDHIYNNGVTAESKRRDKIDADKKDAADKELARLAGLLTEAKALLASAQVDLETKKKELNDAQNRNANLQSDLVAGRSKLLVLTRGAGGKAADPTGATTGPVDNRPAVTAELDGHVAASLVGLTDTGDSAIRRLNGCIVKYNALAKAVNTAGENPQ